MVQVNCRERSATAEDDLAPNGARGNRAEGAMLPCLYPSET
jgi:hypothetical protein